MATRTQSTVVAVFRNNSDAQAAADELKAKGFTADDIYISSYAASATAGATSTSETGTGGYQDTRHREGGIKGWFKSLFGEEGDETDRSYYEDAVSSGNVLLSVDVNDDNLDTVVDILERHDPIDVNRDTSAAVTEAKTSSAAAAGEGRTTSAGARRQSSKGTSQDLPKSIPVVQEDVRVGKRSVMRGGVRVYSRVVEQPVEETVHLQEEHVRVERQPVNRPADASDLQSGRDEVIEVQETAEEPVVSKEARVVEEVRISKDATERTETVRDKVRRTEVNVENLNETKQGTPVSTGNFQEDFRRDFQSRYAKTGGKYEDYGPAYEYGYESASDPRYQGRSWDQVESDLRTDYGRRYPNSTWERMKDAVRYGWDKVTGHSKSATASR